MKYTLSCFVVFVLSEMACLAAVNDSFVYKGLNYRVLTDTTVTIASNRSYKQSTLVIPEKVSDGTQDYTVTEISDEAFYYCENIRDVTFPPSITSIGSYAFFGNNFAIIDLPSALQTIGEEAFKSPNYDGEPRILSIPPSAKKIGSCAFDNIGELHITDLAEYCNISFGDEYSLGFWILPPVQLDSGINLFIDGKLISHLVIPSSVQEIKRSAFDHMNIYSVEIPNSVVSIGSDAFSSTYISNIELPNSVQFIGEYAFENSALTTIHIPPSLKSIGRMAFYGAPFEEVYITDLEAWCNIDFEDEESNRACHVKRLYLNREEVNHLVIPQSIKNVKDYAFHGFSIYSVELHDSIVSIGRKAFFGLPLDVRSPLVIPNSVRYIGPSAFSGCPIRNLTIGRNISQFGHELNWQEKHISNQWDSADILDVTYLSESPVSEDDSILAGMFAPEVYKNATLHYLASAEDIITTYQPWSLFENKHAIQQVEDSDVDYSWTDDYWPGEASIVKPYTEDDEEVIVYTIGGLRVYSGVKSQMSLPSGLYIIVSPHSGLRYKKKV